MRNRIGFATVLIATIWQSPANSQQMPRYDVPSHCGKIANIGGTYSAMIEQGCFDLEQSSYNSTKAIWGSLPKSMRDHCEKIATVGGTGSYQILQGCIELENSAATTSKEFKY